MFRRRRRFGRRRRRFRALRRGGYKGKFITRSRMGRGGPRPELKYYDAWDGGYLDGSVVGWFNFSCAGGNFLILNRVPEGTSANSRIGRRINMKSIELRIVFAFLNAADATTVAEFYRIMLVYDRQSNAALPAWTDIIASTKQNAANNTSGMSPLNLNNRDRFLILRDWTWHTSVTSTEAVSAAADKEHVLSGRMPPRLHWYIKLKGAETTFNTTAAAANDAAPINTGSLFLMTVGANWSSAAQLGSASTNSCAMLCTSRLRFYD